MAVKNAGLGGTDWNTPDARIKPTDLNDTFDAVVDSLVVINNQQLEQNINILINAAAAGSALEPYDDMFLDIFSVAAGFDGTVDTGNTDAIYDADNDVYKNSNTNNWTYTLPNPQVFSGEPGLQFSVQQNCKLQSFTTKATLSGGWDLANNSAPTTIIASGSYSGKTATPDFDLVAGQTYFLTLNVGGGQPVINEEGFGTKSKGLVTMIHSTLGGHGSNIDTSNIIEILDFNVGLTPVDAIVQTNAQAITADPVAHQIFSHYTLAGSGAISYDISFDGGSTWDTDQPLNTRNITSKTGSSMKIKLNLDGVGSGNTAEAKDYSAMLYY